MPHNFIKLGATTPNPGRRTAKDVGAICERHHGKLEHLWFDAPDEPVYAYALVDGGDVDGMLQDLGGVSMQRLYDASEVR